MLVLDDHLAIDQGSFAGQLAASIDHPPIGPRPVIAVAGEGTELATIDDDQGAVAIMLDLVNPALSGRRFWWRAFAVSLACAPTSADAGSVTNTAIGTLAGLEHFSMPVMNDEEFV